MCVRSVFNVSCPVCAAGRGRGRPPCAPIKLFATVRHRAPALPCPVHPRLGRGLGPGTGHAGTEVLSQWARVPCPPGPCLPPSPPCPPGSRGLVYPLPPPATTSPACACPHHPRPHGPGDGHGQEGPCTGAKLGGQSPVSSLHPTAVGAPSSECTRARCPLQASSPCQQAPASPCQGVRGTKQSPSLPRAALGARCPVPGQGELSPGGCEELDCGLGDAGQRLDLGVRDFGGGGSSVGQQCPPVGA